MTTVGFNLTEHCLSPSPARPDDDVALIHATPSGATTLTWRQARRRTGAIQAALVNTGVRPGSRVLIALPSSPDYALAFLAITGLGAIAVPASPQLTPPELATIAHDCSPAVILTDRERHEALRAEHLAGGTLLLACAIDDELATADAPLIHTRDPEQPAYLVYTSGTTGRPRGVLHAHRSVAARAIMRASWTGIARGDRVLHASELNWTYAMGISVLDAWPVGASTVIWTGPREATRWPELIAAHGVTIFAAGPGVYRQLLARALERGDERLTSLRHALTAGEALPPALLAAWTTTTGVALHEALGMSECSTFISSGPSVPVRPGSPGRIQPGRHVGALDQEAAAQGRAHQAPVGTVGILAIRSDEPGLMLGYRAPDGSIDLPLTDGWFLTGDLVETGPDGYVRYLGRRDEVLNALGYRVSPLEVEAALEGNPDVREVAVTAVRVRADLELVCAWVVATDSDAAARLSHEALDRWCRERLAAFKCPRVFRLVTALPRTRTGKIQRGALETVAFTELERPG